METLDTRDLIDERNNLKELILGDFNERFNTEFDDFDEVILERLSTEDFSYIDQEAIQEFQDYWEDEYTIIKEIDTLENEVDSYVEDSFEYGVFLIAENDFEEYCEEELEQCGYFSKDFPQWIKNNIDWEGIASDMRQDYSEVEFRGTTYLYR